MQEHPPRLAPPATSRSCPPRSRTIRNRMCLRRRPTDFAFDFAPNRVDNARPRLDGLWTHSSLSPHNGWFAFIRPPRTKPAGVLFCSVPPVASVTCDFISRVLCSRPSPGASPCQRPIAGRSSPPPCAAGLAVESSRGFAGQRHAPGRPDRRRRPLPAPRAVVPEDPERQDHRRLRRVGRTTSKRRRSSPTRRRSPRSSTRNCSPARTWTRC